MPGVKVLGVKKRGVRKPGVEMRGMKKLGMKKLSMKVLGMKKLSMKVPGMRPSKAFAVIIAGCSFLLAGTFSLAGCAIVPERAAPSPELIEPVGVEVDMLEVKRGTLTIELNGTGVIVPAETEYQYFEIDGQLESAFVEPGDTVRKGDPLFQLDADNFDMRLLQQQLVVENRRIAMDQLRGEPNGDADKDNRWLAGINYKIEQMRLDQIIERHNKRTIVAAQDGIVTFVDDIRAGGKIDAYRPIVGIARNDELQLRYIGDIAPYLSNIKLGMEAELSVQTASGFRKTTSGASQTGAASGASQTELASDAPQIALDISLKGTVASVPALAPIDSSLPRAPVLEKTIYFDLEPSTIDSVEIGDYIHFRLELVRKENTLIIPRGALRNYQGRDFVLIADGETLREVDVQRGIVTPTEAEIVAGLAEGQKVVVTR